MTAQTLLPAGAPRKDRALSISGHGQPPESLAPGIHCEHLAVFTRDFPRTLESARQIRTKSGRGFQHFFSTQLPRSATLSHAWSLEALLVIKTEKTTGRHGADTQPAPLAAEKIFARQTSGKHGHTLDMRQLPLISTRRTLAGPLTDGLDGISMADSDPLSPISLRIVEDVISTRRNRTTTKLLP